VLVFGIAGAIVAALDFHVAPVLLGYVLGPMVEEYFRRALLQSHGDMMVFLDHPISAAFIAASALLIVLQFFFRAKQARQAPRRAEAVSAQ
jgi:TctA family transporter